MGFHKNQAWVTSAVNNASVHSALVLAESILKSKSIRKIAVITSLSVSVENRQILREKFDFLILMEEIGTRGGTFDDTQAKAYAFLLTTFEKCVFVSNNCLFVENADKLFESNQNFECSINTVDGSLDLTLFMFQPNKTIWTNICKSITSSGQDLSEKYLSTWLQNQDLVARGTMKNEILAKLSLSTGKVFSNQIHTPIIHFEIDNQNGNQPLIEQIQKYENRKDVGVRERILFDKWLEIYREICSSAPTMQEITHAYNLSGLIDVNEPIAIVGMSCRYPRANNLEEFWNLLYSGEEGIREPPAFRWTKEHSIMRVTPQDRKSQAGFLSVPLDEFDARFFGVSPKEAAYMDPQARLLHEVMWESLEDAGIDPLSLYGSHTGIFTGSWMNDYKDIVAGSEEKDFFRTYMGNSMGAIAARLSFLLGLTCPSIATESGCSSAIVALDLAIKSLRCGETRLAIAGGVNLILHPFTSEVMEHIVSPNGRCKTFDAGADGFGRAEGCGVLVLKRLSDALQDRDNIWALIRGSAVSQEGISRSLGTPTVQCEALAMKLAMTDAGISPEQVTFVETHGTGTAVGDSIEVAAIAKAYYSPKRKQPLIIGSVKTNVGHAESCSGILGVMKAVLALQHELIPKHLNLETINPEIFLDSIPAIIPMENLPWAKVPDKPRICGVSSFGITGTDGHVIIQEAPDYELPKFSLGLERPTHLMTISAKSGKALEDLLKMYENRFSEAGGEKGFANVAYSANVGRAHFNHRAMLLASSYEEAGRMIKEGKILRGELKERNNSQICFLFTGQGSQYPGMAKTLYETSPVFRIHFDSYNRTLEEEYNLSIRQVLWESDSKELRRTIYSQTSIFCIEYCLLKLWQSWGIKPDYVLGHSLGEFCAAVAAGVLDFDDALKLVAERSRLIDNLPQGSMLVVKAGKPEVEKWMKAAKIDLDFAAVNNPEQTVVAGDTKTVETFLAYLKRQGTKAIILEATHAFHSRHMDPILEQYRKVAQSIVYKPGNPNIAYISGMEGRLIDNPSELGADYWVRHTREKVSFMDACAALIESGVQDFIEVGPQPVLSSFLMSNNEGTPFNCFPSLRRWTNDWDTILTSLGKLYLLGYQVDWKGYDEPYIRKKVSLPFHPFHRKSFWVDCTSNTPSIIHPLLGSQFSNASALTIFQQDLHPKLVPYFKDHCLGNRILFPGAGFIEMCLSAGYCVSNGLTEYLEPPTNALRLENFRIETPLELKEDKPCRLQTIVDLPENPSESTTSGFRVKIFHRNNLPTEESGEWVLHASSNFNPGAHTKDCMSYWNPDRIPEIISSTEPTTPEAFYKSVDETGLKFGKQFRMLRRFWAVKQQDYKTECDEIVAEMELPPDWSKYLVHPLIIDATFQTGILTEFRYKQNEKLNVPVAVGALTLFTGMHAKIANLGHRLYLHAWKENEKTLLFISTQNWSPLVFMENVELVETTVKTIESVLDSKSNGLPDTWEETWRPLHGPFSNPVTLAQGHDQFSDNLEFVEQATTYAYNTPEELELFDKNKRLIYLYIVRTCLELGWKPEVGQQLEVNSFCTLLKIQSQFRKLVRFYFTVLEEEDTRLLQNLGYEKWRVIALPPQNQALNHKMEKLTEELKASSLYSNLTSTHEIITKNLSRILLGEQSALALLFPSEEESEQKSSASVYYDSHPSNKKVSGVFKLLLNSIAGSCEALDKSVNGGKGVYRVLEVGSGTGSATAYALEALGNVWGNRFEYYFTDISQAFSSKAEKRFPDFVENLKFEVFNIEQSPLGQGIPVGYFDFVCAHNVLHATRDLEESLVHLRQTLRPGGSICIAETVIPARDITFVFGLLEGYWRFEDFQRRPNHCCVGEEVWGKVIQKSGFNNFHAFMASVDQFACMTAMADSEVKMESLQASRWLRVVQSELATWVVFTDGSSLELGTKVANSLVVSGNKVIMALKPGGGIPEGLREGVVPEVVKFEEEDASGIEQVLRSGAVQGVVYSWGMNLNERDERNVALPFLHVAKTVAAQEKPPRLYLVTKGVRAVIEDTSTIQPTPAILHGMAKSLKAERIDCFVRIVDLEMGCSVEDLTGQLLYELALSRGTKEKNRLQVAYRGNVRYEPRLGKALTLAQSGDLKLPRGTDRYHLKLPGSRMIQDLEFVPLEVEPVGDFEIEMKVKAYALNFRDIFAIIKPSKKFEELNGVGMDFAGVVTKAGKKAGWKVGQRVFGYNYKEEQLPSHYVIDSRFVMGIPDKMTYWEAATLPVVLSTAYHSLVTVARIKKGDKVLIHTGSGGVGLAAIQVAKHVGAEIITTAGNPRKRAYLRGLGIQHVFHSRDVSFEQDILRVTNGQGVDIVLNSITGPGIKEATLKCTAANGRFVEMSKQGSEFFL